MPGLAEWERACMRVCVCAREPERTRGREASPVLSGMVGVESREAGVC